MNYIRFIGDRDRVEMNLTYNNTLWTFAIQAVKSLREFIRGENQMLNLKNALKQITFKQQISMNLTKNFNLIKMN